MTKIHINSINITGLRFGKLVVIEYSHSHYGCQFLCRCDCGTEKVIGSQSLRKGGIQDCGCVKDFNTRTRTTANNCQTQWQRIFRNYRSKAGRRGIKFDLTEDEAIPLLKADCYYCKAPPGNVHFSGSTRVGFKILYNGIDRFENDIGYVTGNVVTCCKFCNVSKSDRSSKQFLTWVHQLARHTIEPYFELSDLSENYISRHPVIGDVLAIYG